MIFTDWGGGSFDGGESWGGGYWNGFPTPYAGGVLPVLQVQNGDGVSPSGSQQMGGVVATDAVALTGVLALGKGLVAAANPLLGTVIVGLGAFGAALNAAANPAMGGAGAQPLDMGFDPLGNATSGMIAP